MLKRPKYEDLEMECRKNGWKTRFYAVEVGARGYVAESMRQCWSRLGLVKVKRIFRQVSDTALRWSSTDKRSSSKDNSSGHSSWYKVWIEEPSGLLSTKGADAYEEALQAVGTRILANTNQPWIVREIVSDYEAAIIAAANRI